ncbi:hypothetical protein LY76DRAFT_249196 [Colletotrichum caudatum]|nr:hypothetical protein LY76DRAFT_249196 [Colletotrichum caudatum]
MPSCPPPPAREHAPIWQGITNERAPGHPMGSMIPHGHLCVGRCSGAPSRPCGWQVSKAPPCLVCRPAAGRGMSRHSISGLFHVGERYEGDSLSIPKARKPPSRYAWPPLRAARAHNAFQRLLCGLGDVLLESFGYRVRVAVGSQPTSGLVMLISNTRV